MKVIVINGHGGCGKDTLISVIEKDTKYKVANESSIDPIKNIARQTTNWDGGKSDKDRKFLSDLKRIYTEYCDLPTNYLIDKYINNVVNGKDMMFCHIREASEIDKFKEALPKTAKVYTLLVYRDETDNHSYGNASDDDVNKYNYDFVFDNNKTLDEAAKSFIELINKIMEM